MPSITKFSIPMQVVDHMFLNAHTEVPVFKASVSEDGVKTVTVCKSDVPRFQNILRGSLFRIVSHKVKETSLKILAEFNAYVPFSSSFEAFWEEKTNKLYIVGTQESKDVFKTTPHAVIFKCMSIQRAWLKIDLASLNKKDSISVLTTNVDRIEKITYVSIGKQEEFYVYRQKEALYTTINIDL